MPFPILTAISAAREVARRAQAAFARGRERATLERLSREPVHLKSEYASLSPIELLRHFRQRRSKFFTGFAELPATAEIQKTKFPDETRQLIKSADLILQHRWPLLGFGELSFHANVNWLRDPLSESIWPLDYHGDVQPRTDHSADIRVLWELNRLGHFITLSRAYAVTDDARYADELIEQFDSWLDQNPLGLGPNWNSAMEVALRAMNLLAALTACIHSRGFDQERLPRWLQSLEQHAAHVKRNLEFSYLGATNHYLTNVVGVLWIGLTLPELASADEWCRWALRELFVEMDKQVLPDGGDYECSTAYHRYVLELFLYSFILCKQNEIKIEARYWQRLRTMLAFVQSYVRPDGAAPLIGDGDGTRVLPITRRGADDHSYLLRLGAAALRDSDLKNGAPCEEILWLCGEDQLKEYESLGVGMSSPSSQAFPDSGVYVMRHKDLYLLFNAARHLRTGRSSHRHNDALSIEVSAGGRAFIVDPGTYVYSGDLSARHLFRSTAYHSTVQVDHAEQNTIDELKPFLFGGEARPKVTNWQTSADEDRVTGVHFGYERLAGKVVHERTVVFNKQNRWWQVDDQLHGSGTHEIATRFHLANGLEVELADRMASIREPENDSRLLIVSVSRDSEEFVLNQPVLESQFVSQGYGSRLPSLTLMWSTTVELPCRFTWALIPVCASEDEHERLRVLGLR